MRKYYKVISIFLIAILTFTIVNIVTKPKSVTTNAGTTEGLSTKKIGWGIKRNNNHEQPDLGSKNVEILSKFDGIAMGNKESKKVYLTFDEGYEAGYTEKILNVLKENQVTAAFFITAHYVNTQPDLVQRMIDEGHIVREPYRKS